MVYNQNQKFYILIYFKSFQDWKFETSVRDNWKLNLLEKLNNNKVDVMDCCQQRKSRRYGAPRRKTCISIIILYINWQLYILQELNQRLCNWNRCYKNIGKIEVCQKVQGGIKSIDFWVNINFTMINKATVTINN